MDLDEGMEDVIRVMNQHPGVETTGSCSGHFRACVRSKSQYEDSELEDWNLFCTPSTAPYVQFRAYPNQADIEAFLERMRSAPSIPGGIHVYHQHDDEWTVGSGQTGEMIVDDEFAIPWSLPPRTAFAEFWTIFIEAWNSAVSHFQITQPPTKFRIYERCRQCGR